VQCGKYQTHIYLESIARLQRLQEKSRSHAPRGNAPPPRSHARRGNARPDAPRPDSHAPQSGATCVPTRSVGTRGAERGNEGGGAGEREGDSPSGVREKIALSLRTHALAVRVTSSTRYAFEPAAKPSWTLPAPTRTNDHEGDFLLALLASGTGGAFGASGGRFRAHAGTRGMRRTRRHRSNDGQRIIEGRSRSTGEKARSLFGPALHALAARSPVSADRATGTERPRVGLRCRTAVALGESSHLFRRHGTTPASALRRIQRLPSSALIPHPLAILKRIKR
jgi:hypothetical protein